MKRKILVCLSPLWIGLQDTLLAVEVLIQNTFYFMMAIAKLLSRKAVPSPQCMRISDFSHSLGIVKAFIFASLMG